MKKIFSTSSVGFVFMFGLGCMSANENSNGCIKISHGMAVDMCDNQPSRVFMQKVSVNPIFNVTDKIAIPEYNFTTGSFRAGGDTAMDSICSIKGDCCNALRLVDRFSSNPEFQWNTIANKLIVAAIFDSPVELFPNGLSIKNTQSIVWTWDSGMGTGSQSSGVTYVSYQDGKRVIDSKVTNQPLLQLESGKMYEWCVWAWSDDGTKITSASTAFPFVVDSLNVEKNNLGLIAGEWRLKSAIRKADSKNIAASFPLTKLSIDLTCSGGTCVINNSKLTEIEVRNNQYIDFSDPGLGITSLRIKWLCANSILSATVLNGAEVEVLFER